MKNVTIPLALAQTFIWAASFYLLPALLPVLERETDWTKGQITGALTAALLVSAISAPFVGKGIDLGFGRIIMGLSMVLASCMLFAFSFAESLFGLYACWLIIGLCMAGMLYEPCFAIVTRHFAENARSVITHITLIAGFAGTLSFPIANWLSAEFSWQVAVRFFAVTSLVLAFPLGWMSLRKLEAMLPVMAANPSTHKTKPTKNRRLFWSLAFAFTFGGINHGMLIAHLLPLLAEKGVGQSIAVMAVMVIGPMQVVGRFVFMRYESKTPSTTIAFICMGGMALAALLLWFAGASLPLIFFSTALQGSTWGLVSITKPAITREMLGQENFGVTSGRLAGIFTFGVALAPALGSLLWKAGGYDLMLLTGFSFAVIGVFLLKLAFGFRTT